MQVKDAIINGVCRVLGKVYSPEFVGKLTGNADSATKATQDESGNNIKASYASSVSISDHTITLKNKNGASLGSVTVPKPINNLTTTTAGNSLDAAQGKVLNDKIEENKYVGMITDELGTPWTAGGSIVTDGSMMNDLFSVTYGNGKFAAVCNLGSYCSENGIDNWIEGRTPQSVTLNSVIYGDGKFVTVGMYGASYYSEDGITWTTGGGVMPSNHTAYSVTYGNGKFVAVGSYGYYGCSLDGGISWSGGDMTSDNNDLYSVTYGNGKFVAVGQSGCTYYSEDGITWLQGGSAENNNLFSVTYGNGKFVAFNKIGTAYYSDDGIGWATGGFNTGGIAVRSVACGNGMFVAVSDNGASYYSEDGISWATGGHAGGDILRGITYANGKFVTVGDHGSNYYLNFIRESKLTENVVNDLYELLANGRVKFQVTADGKLQYSVYTE